MKKLVLLAFLLGLVHKSGAMDSRIKLPSQQELSDRLCLLQLQDFAEKTKIDVKLGGQERRPLAVVEDLEAAISDYQKLSQNPMMGMQMQLLKPMILKEFLKDHPQAMEHIQQNLLR